MKHIFFSVPFLIALAFGEISGRISNDRSSIIYPAWETKGPKTPLIVGYVLNKNGTPIRREPIILSIDGINISIVLSNSHGIWAYSVRPSDELMEGFHIITARSARSGVALQSTRFIAAFDQKQLPKVGAGNAAITHSQLIAPQGNCLNYRNPLLVGLVRNADGAPVYGEVVTVSVDGIALGRALSDERGVFAYVLNKEQLLSDGEHIFSAFCGNSALELHPISFRIDTTDPKIPVISLPDPGSCVKSPVSVSGTAEPYTEVLIFIDNAEESELTYADEKGEWGMYISLEPGDHSIEVSARDCAGNQGKLSPDVEFFVEA